MPESVGRPVRLLVVDDHPIIREGIASVIAAHADIMLVGEAHDGVDAVVQFDAHRPDVTLMDLQMPRMSGLSAIGEIRAHHPEARIVVLSTYRGDVRALRALKAGACGYVLKNAIRKDLVAAIREVHAGGRFIDPEIALELSSRVVDEQLSHRETDVINEVATGAENKEIATRLGISEETVKTHMKSILAKLGVGTRMQAVSIARRRGILNDEE